MSEKSYRTVTQLLHEQHELIKDLFHQVSATSGDERAEVFDCLRATLAVHETAEEELVHPAARLLADDADAIVAARTDLLEVGQQLLGLRLLLQPGGDGFEARLAELEFAVLEHAEAEEHELFPLLDAGHDTETLQKLGTALLAAERLAPTHPHPHGPESALGNMLVGPFVAMVDRARDAIRKAAA